MARLVGAAGTGRAGLATPVGGNRAGMGKKRKSTARTIERPRSGSGRDVLAGTVPVATFATLADVQDALAHLADDVPIDRTTIVGTDLRLVELVEGRMSRARAAGYGTGSGAWLGALVAAFAAIFSAHSFAAVMSMLFGGIMLGAAFGAVFGLVAYAFAGPRDGITGNLSLVASRYELRATADRAGRLRELLSGDLPVPDPASADELLTRH